MPQGVRVRVSPPAQIHFHLMIIQDFTANEVTNKIDEISFSWESPSNIALVKYWGKNPDQTPKIPLSALPFQTVLQKHLFYLRELIKHLKILTLI